MLCFQLLTISDDQGFICPHRPQQAPKLANTPAAHNEASGEGKHRHIRCLFSILD